jgi:succinoglycan biosynthesis protein ExoV
MAIHLFYWSEQREHVNFGDYISLFLYNKLIDRLAEREEILLLGVGSILHAPLLNKVLNTRPDLAEMHVWGSGARGPHGPALSSLESRMLTRIYGVRGSYTAQALQCSPELAIGDPGFLLPWLIQARSSKAKSGTTFVPHLSQCKHAPRSEALLAESRCDRVLPPLIDPTPAALESFVADLCSSSFILTNSLHGAILAQAYGIPYSYGTVGDYLNCPFKWKDHSSTIGADCLFAANLEQGEKLYRENFSRALTPDAARILHALPEHWLSPLARALGSNS